MYINMYIYMYMYIHMYIYIYIYIIYIHIYARSLLLKKEPKVVSSLNGNHSFSMYNTKHFLIN